MTSDTNDTRFGVGAEGPSFEVGPLTRTDFVRYAAAAGDFNPLHHDEFYAQRAGHRSVFAHGMFSAGLLASFLVKWFGPDSVRRFSVQFKEQVWPDDVMRAAGTIVRLEKDGEMDLAAVKIALLNQRNVAAVTGEAVVIVPTKG